MGRRWKIGLVVLSFSFLFPSSLYADAASLITAALRTRALAQRLRQTEVEARPSRGWYYQSDFPGRAPSKRSIRQRALPTTVRPAREGSYEVYVQEAARRYRVDPHLIRAVIDVESGGDPHAFSPAGARGLMQVMPETASTLGVRPHLLWDERVNVLTGTRYLRDQLETFGNVRDALVAYNSGPDTIIQGKPIPAETRKYVPKVLNRYRVYRLVRR